MARALLLSCSAAVAAALAIWFPPVHPLQDGVDLRTKVAMANLAFFLLVLSPIWASASSPQLRNRVRYSCATALLLLAAICFALAGSNWHAIILGVALLGLAAVHVYQASGKAG